MTMPSEVDRTFTREEYYSWREAQPRGRFERIDGRIVAMAPERAAHVRTKTAVWLVLRNALRSAGVPCQSLGDGVTVQTGDSDYEPDALVNCGAPMADEAITAPNPVIVVEVLSPSTQSTDTGGKLAGYFSVPSIMHYLIVHPIKHLVIHHRRRHHPDGIDTTLVTTGTIELRPPGITICVDDIYEA